MAEPARSFPGFSGNPFANPALLADPYPFYAMLRASSPVLKVPIPVPDYSGPGVAVLTRFADIESALRDERFSVDRRKADVLRLMPADALNNLLEGPDAFVSMLTQDPPDHTRVRGLVSKAFTPRRVEERLRPRIEALVTELLDDAEAKGGMDVLRDFGEPLPAIVIAELLGVPVEDRARFKAWSRDLIGQGPARVTDPDAQEKASATIRAFMDYMRGIIAERRRAPGDDLISGMIAAQEERDALSDQELLSTSLLILIAGHETTTNLIGNGTFALLRHPEQLAKLQADPTLLDDAVEELLRYDSPVQGTIRVVTEDLEVGGVPLEQGCLAVCLLGAGNRDPEVYEAPDTLDVTRTGMRHLSFGFGTHFCLGAGLARLEARTAFRELVGRFPALALDIDPADVTHRPNPILRGLESLPVLVR
jgi:pimeloyl-[acyl-carrier protein] synthase